MASPNELPDSTDWLATSLPELEPLEAALRCEVCKEFYTNPVITPCSHTFCSICIRRCIATDGRCPSCKAACSSDKLTMNIAVRDVVGRFVEVRGSVLELARRDVAGEEEEEEEEEQMGEGERGGEASTRKRKLDDTDLDDGEGRRQIRPRQTRSQKNHANASQNTPAVIADSESDGDEFLPEGMAKCPICNKSMKEEQVYNHLDVCPGQAESRSRSTRSRTKTAFPNPLQRRAKEPSPPPTRLSQLNYAMLKEGALRKKLQDLGIPNWGSKDLLKRRHIEWLNIYNSNCDAGEGVRKVKKQLLDELKEWENTQGGRADNRESRIMKKDFDGDGYAKSHKSDFDDLIARARQKRAVPMTEERGDRPHTPPHTNGEEPGQSDNVVKSVPLAVTMNGTAQGIDICNHATTRSSSLNHSKPYENNESALSSIRAKVQEANSIPAKLPPLSLKTSCANATAAQQHARDSHSQSPATGIQNPFGSPSKKVPMFAVPEEPVRDTDGSAAVL